MCHFSAARRVLRHISRHCGWYLINIWWTWRLLHFWLMWKSLDQLKSNEPREITTFKSRTWLWNCNITTVKNEWQTFYTDCPKAEVVWGRLVSFVSGSLPAMGCGGSKAQPTSEVVHLHKLAFAIKSHCTHSNLKAHTQSSFYCFGTDEHSALCIQTWIAK